MESVSAPPTEALAPRKMAYTSRGPKRKVAKPAAQLPEVNSALLPEAVASCGSDLPEVPLREVTERTGRLHIAVGLAAGVGGAEAVEDALCVGAALEVELMEMVALREVLAVALLDVVAERVPEAVEALAVAESDVLTLAEAEEEAVALTEALRVRLGLRDSERLGVRVSVAAAELVRDAVLAGELLRVVDGVELRDRDMVGSGVPLRDCEAELVSLMELELVMDDEELAEEDGEAVRLGVDD